MNNTHSNDLRHKQNRTDNQEGGAHIRNIPGLNRIIDTPGYKLVTRIPRHVQDVICTGSFAYPTHAERLKEANKIYKQLFGFDKLVKSKSEQDRINSTYALQDYTYTKLCHSNSSDRSVLSYLPHAMLRVACGYSMKLKVQYDAAPADKSPLILEEQNIDLKYQAIIDYIVEHTNLLARAKILDKCSDDKLILQNLYSLKYNIELDISNNWPDTFKMKSLNPFELHAHEYHYNRFKNQLDQYANFKIGWRTLKKITNFFNLSKWRTHFDVSLEDMYEVRSYIHHYAIDFGDQIQNYNDAKNELNGILSREIIKITNTYKRLREIEKTKSVQFNTIIEDANNYIKCNNYNWFRTFDNAIKEETKIQTIGNKSINTQPTSEQREELSRQAHEEEEQRNKLSQQAQEGQRIAQELQQLQQQQHGGENGDDKELNQARTNVTKNRSDYINKLQPIVNDIEFITLLYKAKALELIGHFINKLNNMKSYKLVEVMETIGSDDKTKQQTKIIEPKITTIQLNTDIYTYAMQKDKTGPINALIIYKNSLGVLERNSLLFLYRLITGSTSISKKKNK